MSFIAQKMYPELMGLTVDEIKKKHDDKRYSAKTAGFAINYGGVGATIAKNNNLTLEQGNAVYEAYFNAFPGLQAYFNRVKKEALDNGYILISSFTGRKCFVDDYEKYLILKKKMNMSYWDVWKKEKAKGTKSSLYLEMKEDIQKYFKIKGSIERMSLNYPIQGKSGEITKNATVLFFNWIRSKGYLDKVLIPNTIHDELVAECEESMAEEVKEVLQKCMEDAGAVYYTRVPLRAKPVITKKWQK